MRAPMQMQQQVLMRWRRKLWRMLCSPQTLCRLMTLLCRLETLRCMRSGLHCALHWARACKLSASGLSMCTVVMSTRALVILEANNTFL